jgi:twitching motility protein PilT
MLRGFKVEENLFGQILINNHFMEKHDLEKALEMQAASRGTKFLGEILVEQGYITKGILNSILSIQRRRLELTQATKKLISPDEVTRMLKAADIVGILLKAREVGASDFYLIANTKPTVRLHGNIIDLETALVSPAEVQEIIARLLDPVAHTQFMKSHDYEMSIDLAGHGRCRVNMFKDYYGYGAVFRLFPERVHTLQEMGFPQVIKDFANLNRGLILITGPASSGKSTTMNSLVEEINLRSKGHIITIESPIEVVFQSKGCIVTQREVGRHTRSFSGALRAALREDPDYIVVSELKDLETIQTAIQAAETGHLVMGTLPTGSAVRTLHRVIDAFPDSQQAQIRGMLSGTLKAIISQQLVQNIDGRGRSLAQEILIINPAVSNFIRESRTYQIPSAIQLGKEYGMQLMDDSLMDLVKDKKISVEEAFVRAENKERFETLKLTAG